MIYIIENIVDGKQYIGKTNRPIEIRFYFHKKNVEYGKQTYLYKAMRKHGVDNFKIKLLENCAKEQDNERERYWIQKLQPHYNMTTGGDGGRTADSPNYKISLANRDMSGVNNPMYGKKGVLNPKFGKKYGNKPNISESKKKTLKSSDGLTFKGFQEMFSFYNVKSYYSLKKNGITWSEINDFKQKE